MIQIAPDRLCDRAAEAATLGSMIVDHKVIPAVLEYLTADSFFLEEHNCIFQAVVDLWRQNPGGAVDGLLLRSRLDESGKLKDVGGLDYLQQVVDTVPYSSNAIHYARRVLAKQRYRRLVAAAEQIERTITNGGDVDEQTVEVQRLAMSLDCDQTASSVFDVSKHATQVALDTQNGSDAIPTGFVALDRIITGMNPGELDLIAARPSMGKTALACGIALNVAKAGKHVLFVTLEMSARSLIERLIAMLAGVCLKAIKSGPPQDVLNQFYEGSLALEKLPITIVENATTPEKQAAIVQAQKQGAGADVIMVDYLGLMDSGEKTRSRNDEVSAISKKLKHMAQRYGVAVLALSQLNRDCEHRDNRRPRLSDLRDSGSLEQDADVTIFLHREDYYRRQNDPETTDFDGLAEIIVAKQRNGPTDVARMIFLQEQIRFVDYVGVQ